MDAPDLYRGQRIGKYEVVTRLNVGGMAELFLAFTAGPGGFRKYVVIKRILPDVKSDEHFVKMFLDEARITAAFNHPNIAQVYDMGEEEEGLYLAMEFIPGQNLNQITAVCKKREQPLPAGLSAMVARDVSQALHYAHTFADPTGRPFPIIHRDVAQKNVMVAYDGASKLLDFGIAKAKVRLGRTRSGMVKGTTGYMSPEQVRGETLDGRSDIFSVGVMLHEMLTGRRLFAADTEGEEMKKILEGRIPTPSELMPELPRALSQVTMRALSRNREDRFPNARDFAKAVEQAAGKLLYEREQSSAFMREVFDDRVKATQALLESAGGQWKPGEMMKALSLLSQDSGDNFPEYQAHHPRTAPGPEPEDRDTPQAMRVAAELESASSFSPKNRMGPASLVLGLTAIIGLAFLAAKQFAPAPPPETGSHPSLHPVPLVPTPALPDFDARFDGGALSPLPPLGPAAKALAPAGGPEKAPSTGVEINPPKLPTPHHAPAVKNGALTLVTFPPCQVFQGRKQLGRTPLVKVPMPEGSYLLKLVGADGKARLLSVPIQADKTAQLKLELADLPTER